MKLVDRDIWALYKSWQSLFPIFFIFFRNFDFLEKKGKQCSVRNKAQNFNILTQPLNNKMQIRIFQTLLNAYQSNNNPQKLYSSFSKIFVISKSKIFLTFLW